MLNLLPYLSRLSQMFSSENATPPNDSDTAIIVYHRGVPVLATQRLSPDGNFYIEVRVVTREYKPFLSDKIIRKSRRITEQEMEGLENVLSNTRPRLQGEIKYE